MLFFRFMDLSNNYSTFEPALPGQSKRKSEMYSDRQGKTHYIRLAMAITSVARNGFAKPSVRRPTVWPVRQEIDHAFGSQAGISKHFLTVLCEVK